MRSVDAYPLDDVVSFRDGKFRSRYLLLHGFPETPYMAFLEKEASEADRLLLSLHVNNNSADAHLSLEASVETGEIAECCG